MRIAIIDIIGIPYDGSTVYKQGLGGSESAVTYMGEELAQLGFDVTVFNNCTDHAHPGIFKGVQYTSLASLAGYHEFDIVISSRTVIPFTAPEDYHKLGDNRAWMYQGMDLYNRILSKAKMRILWMHDTFCLGDNLIEELATSNRITDIFTLSDFHLSYVANCQHGRRRNFEVLKKKMFITRNGARCHNANVDITAKDKDLFVYNASVTKGMIPLVNDIWPIVKQHIPAARLKVIGGYYRFSSTAEPDAQEKDWQAMVANPAYAQLDIEFTGVILQSEIGNILTDANFMIYPSAFPETFGISSLESLLYNTPVLTCRFGALEEIVPEGAGYHIDYAIEPNSLFTDIDKNSQNQKFAAMVIAAYHNTYLHQQKQYYCNVVKDIAGWNSVALQWKQFFYKQTGNYLSRSDYRAVARVNHKVHKIWNRRYTNPVEFEHYKSSQEQPIVVVSTFYNCKDYIARCIESIACQDYNNYQVYLVDDASTDGTPALVTELLAALPSGIRDKFNFIINSTENMGAVHNQVAVIRALPDPESIVMILDGDDSLVNDNSIFSYYNGIYDNSTEFTYGSCWSVVDNIPLISQPYPESVKLDKSYRQYHFNWILPYTHLRTFKQRLIKGMPDSNFQDNDGKWFKAGGDGATFYNLIEAADPAKVKCLQEIVYNYNDASPLNDYKVNGDEQNKNSRLIVGQVAKRIEQYSVVVPTMWKVADQFVVFVNKLCNEPGVGEVIIINNDDTKTPQGLDHPKIRMYNFGHNIYVNPAWNLGVQESQFDRVCIVNDDVVFDTAVFEKLQYRLSDKAGVFGLCPGTADFNQPPVTTKAIDIIPWTNQHTYGFGCLMFIHKKSWAHIPSGLDIYYGDNYIFDLQLSQGKTNYLIANMDFSSQFAATTSDTTITGGFLERETIVYKQVKADMLAKPGPIIKMTKKKKILIAIPTARNIEPDTFKSIYDLIVPDDCETTFQYFFGYNVDQVRNLIADWVVKGYDYLFSVDSDIAFAPDTLVKLLAHDRDMVTGLYIQRKPGEHILEVYEHNQRGGVQNIPYEKIKGRGLVEIASCGFGCVLVKADVMRAIGYPQFVYTSAIDHSGTISEDIDFCKKALSKGFKLWADTTIQCRHIGSSQFTIDNNIAATIAPTQLQQDQARLRELGQQRLLPQTHLNYLTQLRDSGFEPRVIYDIGACVLHWTNEAKQLWPTAEFIVFEAMDVSEILYKEQGLRYNMGVLSNADDVEVDFYQNNYHPGGNSYYKENEEVNPQAPLFFNETHKRRLKTTTLDTAASRNGFPLPDMIKMDVQGAELDVLKGAVETLKSVKHVILELQVVEYNKGAPLFDIVVDYMNTQGFDCLGIFSNAGPDGDYHFCRRD